MPVLVLPQRWVKLQGQPIPDPSSSWCLRKDPRGVGDGLQGRDIRVTDYCLHPPLGDAPRVSCHVSGLESVTPPKFGPHQTALLVHADTVGQHGTANPGQAGYGPGWRRSVQPPGTKGSFEKREITIIWSHCKLKPGWERSLPAVHTSTSFGTSLPTFPVPLCQRSSKIHGVKLLGTVSQEFLCGDFTSDQL